MNKKPSFPPLSPEAERLDELLDEALIETFPASDPIAINIERIDRRPAEDASKARGGRNAAP
jgi:hypothetical protein